METHLRAQKKFERTGRAMRVVTARIRKTIGWASLNQEQKQTVMGLIRTRINEHIDSVIDGLTEGERLDYDQIAEAGIRTGFDEKIDVFTPVLADNSQADPYTVSELMEDAN